MNELSTWGGKSIFRYKGSVKEGTKIYYGSGYYSIFVSAEQYEKLLETFSSKTVNLGTSGRFAPKGSIGEWLQEYVTNTAIASYVGVILVHEGYARREEGSNIKFF